MAFAGEAHPAGSVSTVWVSGMHAASLPGIRLGHGLLRVEAPYHLSLVAFAFKDERSKSCEPADRV